MHGKVTRFAQRPTRVEHAQAKKRFWAIHIGILHEYFLGGYLQLSHIAWVLPSLCWSGSNFCWFGTYMIQVGTSLTCLMLLLFKRRMHPWWVSWASDLVQGNWMLYTPYSQMCAVARWSYYNIFLQFFLFQKSFLNSASVNLCQLGSHIVPPN